MPNETITHDHDDSDQVLAAFAAHLDAYAAELSDRERGTLMTILVRAMDPLERIRWRDIASILTPNEASVLNELLHEES